MVLSTKNQDLIKQDSYQRAIPDHVPCSSDKIPHHLYGHHHNQYENETFNSLTPKSNLLDNFKKKQHFVHGKPPCGSSNNILTYGSVPATAPKVNSKRWNNIPATESFNEAMMLRHSNEKSTGFLYGEHDTKVGQAQPRKMREKDSLPPWMMDKTSADIRKREIQSQEIEEDLARSRLEKANQRAHYLAEQKKDLQMLQNYRPWGKPGGGAPRGVENDRASTIRTREVDHLIGDNDQALPFGKPGAGAPNRTESGKIKSKLLSDTQIRLRAHRDGRPVDSIPLRNEGVAQYRTELDKLAEETRFRRHKEKEQDFEHDLQTLNYNPFGRPGGGAPLIGDHGSPRTGLPLHFSNHIYELRTTEPRHPHAFSGSNDSNDLLHSKQDFAGVEKQNKLQRQESDDEMDQGFQFGMPGGGAPMRDKNGRVIAHGKHTLVKDKAGALVKSPTSSNEVYYPFGRPGGGAPIRDNRGKVRATVAGVVENEKQGRVGGKRQEGIEAKKGYLDTLKKMQEERESQRVREKSDLLEPAPAISDWLERGLVGRPKYDPHTHEIKANPVMTSDVTRQRMNIHPQASEKSRIYHSELDEIVRQRDEHRIKDSLQERQQSVEHAKTMDRAWGRPGHGAPNADTKKAKMDMIPVDQGLKWRDD